MIRRWGWDCGSKRPLMASNVPSFRAKPTATGCLAEGSAHSRPHQAQRRPDSAVVGQADADASFEALSDIIVRQSRCAGSKTVSADLDPCDPIQQVDMYRVAALYVVERYKPHVLEDIRRALRRARLAQACSACPNSTLQPNPDLVGNRLSHRIPLASATRNLTMSDFSATLYLMTRSLFQLQSNPHCCH